MISQSEGERILHEYCITHAVGIDRPVTGHPLPATMRAYGMQGTPTLMLIDRAGRLRLQHIGRLDDLVVGAEVTGLMSE